MRRSEFIDDPEVQGFLDWLGKTLPTLQVELDIKHSPYVPRGRRASVSGVEAVLKQYAWRTRRMVKGDFSETQQRLAALAGTLRRAVASGDSQATLEACVGVMRWGGDRNAKRGAQRFLVNKSSVTQPGICGYLSTANKALVLSTADTSADGLAPIELMNAMMVKIHSLLSADGLPIYDSRVAAAIACLVEIWRRQLPVHEQNLREQLKFPTTRESGRTVRALFKDAPQPGWLDYGRQSTRNWTSATVRLGWILTEILRNRAKKLFVKHGSLSARIRALEAALFVIGYDVTCLWRAAGLPSRKSTSPRKAVSPKGRGVKGSTRATTLNSQIRRKTRNPDGVRIPAMPNARRTGVLRCSGNVNEGFVVTEWKGGRFAIDATSLHRLRTHFAGRRNVPLGANATGRVPADSIGSWLQVNHLGPRPRASALARILVNFRLVKVSAGGTYQLDFPPMNRTR